MGSVRDALRWALGLLPEASSPTRRREIDRLLAHALRVPSHEIYLSPDRALSPSEDECFRRGWRERLAGRPLQLLLGETEFLSLRFAVRPGVFIPRPETEILVESVMERAREGGGWWVDVGTGTGIIAVSLAAGLPHVNVLATDLSSDALSLAGENARRHGVQERVHRVRGNLLEAFLPAGRLRGIVANPPYIRTADLPSLPVEVREYDPPEALDGGADGMAILRRLVADARALLQPGGWLALEIGETQGDALRVFLGEMGGWAEAAVLPDLAGCPRVLLARRAG